MIERINHRGCDIFTCSNGEDKVSIQVVEEIDETSKVTCNAVTNKVYVAIIYRGKILVVYQNKSKLWGFPGGTPRVEIKACPANDNHDHVNDVNGVCTGCGLPFIPINMKFINNKSELVDWINKYGGEVIESPENAAREKTREKTGVDLLKCRKVAELRMKKGIVQYFIYEMDELQDINVGKTIRSAKFIDINDIPRNMKFSVNHSNALKAIRKNINSRK